MIGSSSQMRAVWSQDAVTTRLPSGLNTALKTTSVCPDSVASAAPVLASHSRAVLSFGRGDDATAVRAEQRAI